MFCVQVTNDERSVLINKLSTIQRQALDETENQSDGEEEEEEANVCSAKICIR